MELLHQIINKVKTKPTIFIIISLLIAIILMLIVFFVLDYKKSTQIEQGVKINPEFNSITQKITTLKNNQDFSPAANADYDKAFIQVNLLNTKMLTEKEQYDNLVLLTGYIQSLYSYTNLNIMYNLINKDLNEFVKKNYSKYYDETYFVYSCQDPSCADSPQPEEILKIVDEINNSDLPDEMKKNISQDLLNTGYRTKEHGVAKAIQYLSTANDVRNLTEFSVSGQNIKIANDIYKYVEKEYPDIYKMYISKRQNE